MNSIIAFIEAHKAADSVAVAWIVRETPLIYNWIKLQVQSVYPYLSANGGIKGIYHTIISGSNNVVETTQQTKEVINEK